MLHKLIRVSLAHLVGNEDKFLLYQLGPSVVPDISQKVSFDLAQLALQWRRRHTRIRGRAEQHCKSIEMRGMGIEEEQNLLRDNEAAHECRHEWLLFTIANSGSSGLPGCTTYGNTDSAALQRLPTTRGRKSRGQSTGGGTELKGCSSQPCLLTRSFNLFATLRRTKLLKGQNSPLFFINLPSY